MTPELLIQLAQLGASVEVRPDGSFVMTAASKLSPAEKRAERNRRHYERLKTTESVLKASETSEIDTPSPSLSFPPSPPLPLSPTPPFSRSPAPTHPHPPTPVRERPQAWNPSPEQLIVSRWFHRRPATAWTAKEIKAWKAIPPELAADGVEVLNAAYSLPNSDGHRVRKDLGTLLNNWQGEMDRWRNFKPAVRSDVQAIETDNDELGFLNNDNAIFHKDRP